MSACARSVFRPKSFAACVSVFLLLMTSSATSSDTVSAPPYFREFGYLPLRDGTRLAYVVYRPTKEGRYPTLVQYDAYNGAGLDGNDSAVKPFVEHGYAYVGVDVRGAACSQGDFELLAPIQAQDGAQVI